MISWEKLPAAISFYINELQIMRGSLEYNDAKEVMKLRMQEMIKSEEEQKLIPLLIECVENYTDITTDY